MPRRTAVARSWVLAFLLLGLGLAARQSASSRSLSARDVGARCRRALGRAVVVLLIVGGGLGSIAAVATGTFDDSTATDRSLPEPQHLSFGGRAHRVAFGRLLGDGNPQGEAIIVVAETPFEPARFAYEMHALETARAAEDAARRAAEDEARRAAEASEAEARAQRFPSDEWWYRIGRCEQPDGSGGVRWNTHGSNATTGVMFVGGLGIMEAAWNQFNVYGFPAGWRATPDQQMTIARDIYARYGPTAWTCSRTAGPAF